MLGAKGERHSMTPANVGLDLLLVLALILINALFVAAEMALVATRRTRIDQLAAAGNRWATLVRTAMEHPVTFIAGTQVGITAAGLVLGWVGEPALRGLIEPVLYAIPVLQSVPAGVLGLVATILSFLLITIVTITFGEIVPKSLALYRAERVALLVVPIVLVFSRLTTPITVLVNGMSERILRLVGVHAVGGRESVHSEEEIRALIAESRQAGLVRPEEEELVRRVFRFGDRIAREVMVPRTRIQAVPEPAAIGEILAAIQKTGFSRLPVYRENLDNIVGVLTAKDALVAVATLPSSATAAQFMRPAYYIPESKELGELLPEMRAQQTQLAVVLDEFGGTAGILTIEDLIEEVVGEIVSEYGSERRFILRHTDQELVVDAELNLDDLNELWGLALPTEEVDTVGGFVYQQLGHIPSVGDSFSYDGFTFRVSSMRGRTIGVVRITRTPGQPE
jgi:CBS domain containing-hemolysin-like protein